MRKIDVLGLGNSLVDIIALTQDDYLVAQNMQKGAMTLIDEPRAESLYAARGADDHLGRLGRQYDRGRAVLRGAQRLYRQGQERPARPRLHA